MVRCAKWESLQFQRWAKIRSHNVKNFIFFYLSGSKVISKLAIMLSLQIENKQNALYHFPPSSYTLILAVISSMVQTLRGKCTNWAMEIESTYVWWYSFPSTSCLIGPFGPSNLLTYGIKRLHRKVLFFPSIFYRYRYKHNLLLSLCEW